MNKNFSQELSNEAEIIEQRTIVIYDRADLVSFGNYLLSQERKDSLVHKVNKNCVTHADIENWIAKQN